MITAAMMLQTQISLPFAKPRTAKAMSNITIVIALSPIECSCFGLMEQDDLVSLGGGVDASCVRPQSAISTDVLPSTLVASRIAPATQSYQSVSGPTC